MIEIEQVDYSIKKEVILKDVSATIQQGESIGVIGPNGAGKSTFLKIIASIVKPSSGKIYYQVNAYEEKIKELRKNIGYIPQDIALFEDLTVYEQITFWQKAARQKVSRNNVSQVVEALHLNEVKDQKIKALSGGWKRKINVGIGLLHQPEFILLDEPTAGVDLAAKDDLIQWLKLLHNERKTLLIISHDWDVLNRLCDKLMIFQQGRLLFFDEVSRLNEFEQQAIRNGSSEELRKILRLR
ncbi:hypothetical protein GCM10008986_15420 [Salinibacillus aidingensis]|uniref:ABC transporter domain-containing protein n=1 Tax=Salinibacillus aidingensis TaxID=237684 RepID=A0ABN1B520_9BACI